MRGTIQSPGGKHKQSDEANPMWGGQFAGGPADAMARINASIDFDRKLYREDIEGSLAHVGMLASAGIVTHEEAERITSGLKAIQEEIEAETFTFREEFEDIHMNIESRLKELIGDVAGKLHTARSRNDQVALDFRMYVRRASQRMHELLRELQDALLTRAEQHAADIMPGFTHLQSAQPVTLGHHLLAYVEMFGRDCDRLKANLARLDECPLGSAALAGTSFPIDRDRTARTLGFARPCANSLDGVSDRDFALDFMSAASISAMHLSRLAEELILWSSAQFSFIRLSDAFSSGSSIMPQKRNPDAAELVRGKTGRISASFQALLMTMKGLPLAYNKDMQEDKEPLFDAFEQWELCVIAMRGMVSDFTINAQRMQEAASAGYATATDLADWLVRALGLPFREAHHVTARIVKAAADKGMMLSELPLTVMQEVEPRITQEVMDVLSVEQSVASRTSFGGTAPVRVREAAAAARKRYE